MADISFGLQDPNAVRTGFDNANAMVNNYVMRQAGQQLGQGDTSGAEQTLNDQGMIKDAQGVQTSANTQQDHEQAVQDHLLSLDKDQRAQRAQFIGDIATTMQNVRETHGDAALMPAYDQLTPVFKAQGVPDDQITLMRAQLASNPDLFIDGMLQHAKKEGYTLGAGQVRFDANNNPVASGPPQPHYQLMKDADGNETLVAIDPATNAPVPGAPPAPAGTQPGQPYVAPKEAITPNVVWTHLQEAGHNPDGLRAVASVAANRARLGHETLDQVVTDPGQFGFGSAEGTPEHQAFLKIQSEFPVGSPQYQHALATITPILTGAQPPVGSYTQYYSPAAQAKFGRPAPSWATGNGINIGGNEFYSNPYKGFAPGTPSGQAAGAPGPIQTGGGAQVLASTHTAPGHYLSPAELAADGYQPNTVVYHDAKGDTVKQPPPKGGTGTGPGGTKLPPDVQARLKSIYTAMDATAQLDSMAQDFMRRSHGIDTGGPGYVGIGGSTKNPTGIRPSQVMNTLFDHDKASAIQTLDAITNRATPLLRPLGSGRILGQEYTNFGRAFPTTKNFPAANAAQAQTLHDEAARIQAHGSFMIHYAQTHGTFDGADDAWQASQGNNNAPTIAPAGGGARHRVWVPGKGLQ